MKLLIALSIALAGSSVMAKSSSKNCELNQNAPQAIRSNPTAFKQSRIQKKNSKATSDYNNDNNGN